MTETQTRLLTKIGMLKNAAYEVLSALEAATRENTRNADAFATLYPFEESFDEIVGQIGEWQDNVAAQMIANEKVTP